MYKKELFLSKVRITDGCWLWIGDRDPDGYGKLSKVDARFCKSKSRVASRVAYNLFKGEIPEGLFVTHSCDNPSCVNPLHLFVKSHAENVKESYDKGRSMQKGERNNGGKLTEADVLAIKLSPNESIKTLGERYGVDPSNITSIRTGKSWEHLTDEDIGEIKRLKGVPLVAIARMFLTTVKRVRKIKLEEVYG